MCTVTEVTYKPIQKAVAISPKITGFLSMLGSGYIIFSVMSSRKKRRKLLNRIVLGLSVSDFSYSFFVCFLSTWPVPTSTPAGLAYGNIGNDVTCQIQGFIDQFSCRMSSTYNVVLALYYLAVVRFQMTDTSMKKYEWAMHLPPFALGFSTATLILNNQIINFTGGWTCWMSDYPLGCTADPDVECERGYNAIKYRLYANIIPLWISIIIMAVAMFLLFLTVYQTERRSDVWMRRSLGSGSHANLRADAAIIAESFNANDSRGNHSRENHVDNDADVEITFNKEDKPDEYKKAESENKDNDENDDDDKNLENGSNLDNESNDKDKLDKDNKNGNDNTTVTTRSSKGTFNTPVVGSPVVLASGEFSAENKVSVSNQPDPSTELRPKTPSMAPTREPRHQHLSDPPCQSQTHLTHPSFHFPSSDNSSPMRRSSLFSIMGRRRSSLRDVGTPTRTRTKAVAVQGVLYILAFFITWLPTFYRIIEALSNGGKNPSGNTTFFIEAFLLPLQGFWNCAVFLRPRYLHYRKSHPEKSYFRAVFDVLAERDTQGRNLSSQRSSRTSGIMSVEPIQRAL